MKTIFIIAFTILNVLIAQAQTTVTSSSTSTSVNTNNDGKHNSSSSSTSIHESGNSYSLRCEFNKSKYEALKKLLIDNLDQNYMTTTSSGNIRWIKEDSDDTAYSVSLYETSVKISVDKKLVSKSAAKKFSLLGEDISALVSSK
ncbi:hypothetical protein [Flavobacterium sp. '19STA2R22 D10 B1']|uniref:hypothetical protein n=1 Tax=Flavobacterium aerium TaxID=3037261 RepID=UPI00278C57BB|nr:hypothetical protein [Flavobacterium sp. '19STA2R22 D10 B1']